MGGAANTHPGIGAQSRDPLAQGLRDPAVVMYLGGPFGRQPVQAEGDLAPDRVHLGEHLVQTPCGPGALETPGGVELRRDDARELIGRTLGGVEPLGGDVEGGQLGFGGHVHECRTHQHSKTEQGSHVSPWRTGNKSRAYRHWLRATPAIFTWSLALAPAPALALVALAPAPALALALGVVAEAEAEADADSDPEAEAEADADAEAEAEADADADAERGQGWRVISMVTSAVSCAVLPATAR